MMRADEPASVAVVGGSPEPSSASTVRRAAARADAVVAIDRGLDAVRDADIGVDVFCGDADSVSAEGAALVRAVEAAGDSAPFEIERYNPHKDDTDLSLALRAIRQRWGAPRLVCTCLSGGHPDHLLGVLGRLASWEGPVEVVEDAFEGRILHAGHSWTIEGAESRRFSFIPLSAACEVSESGMRWDLDHHPVDLLSDLGISNVIEGPEATITCHAGTIVCWTFH